MAYEVESGSVDVDVLSPAGSTARAVHYSIGFCADELNARIEWSEGTLSVTCDKSDEWGDVVEISTWAGRDRKTPRPRKPGDPEPSPTDVRNVRLEKRSREGMKTKSSFMFSDAASIALSDSALETACLAALSDLLCGATEREVMSARFTGEPATYRTYVARFPPTSEGDRSGMFLLRSGNNSSHLRVRGQCRGYHDDYFYEASAYGDELSMWWSDDESIVQNVASQLMLGVPAPYVVPSGKRGHYQVSARVSESSIEADRRVHLNGAELAVARRLARWVDTCRDTFADQRWAEASPTIWPGLSRLVDERSIAESQQHELEDELRGCYAMGNEDDEGALIEPWIFRPDISYEDIAYDLYL